MLPTNQEIVSPERFDELLPEQALIASLPTKDAEAEYQRRDSSLIDLIHRTTIEHFGPESNGSPLVGRDLWQDHTRHLEVTPEHCTPAFFGALREMLAGDYRDYRVQLCVYGGTLGGDSYIGSMALSANYVLIEQDLHALLQPTVNA